MGIGGIAGTSLICRRVAVDDAPGKRYLCFLCRSNVLCNDSFDETFCDKKDTRILGLNESFDVDQGHYDY